MTIEMEVFRGAIRNDFDTLIIPEHPLLTQIKKDSKEDRFSIKSIYDLIHTYDYAPVRDALSNHGVVLTGAIFNGNYEIPYKVIAEQLGINYKPELRQWYTTIKAATHPDEHGSIAWKIMDALDNYRLLSYYDSTDYETTIRIKEDYPIIMNSFTERFSWNHLGHSYLTGMVQWEEDYQVLFLSHQDTEKFTRDMQGYLLGRTDICPEEPDFSENLNTQMIKAIDAELFDCTNVVMITEDFLMVAYPKDVQVPSKEILNFFEVQFASTPELRRVYGFGSSQSYE